MSVEVCVNGVHVKLRWKDDTHWFITPKPIRWFMYAFDDHEYPQLEQT